MSDGDGDDVLFLGPPVPGGGRASIRHRSDHTIEAGVVRPVAEGESALGKQLIDLERREDGPGFNVKVLYDGRTPSPPADDVCTCADEGPRATSDGPAMVNSEGYRDGWDRIFGSKSAKPVLN